MSFVVMYKSKFMSQFIDCYQFCFDDEDDDDDNDHNFNARKPLTKTN